MVDLTDAMREILQSLACSVSQHRKAGGALDALPVRQQELLQAMDERQRQFFLEELAKADADEGRVRFRALLGQWRARTLGSDSDPDTAP